MQKKEKIILGIDPGFAITGFAVIKKENNQISVLEYGHISTSSKEYFAIRLKKLNQGLDKIIKKYNPDIIAIEDLFFAKNVKTALKVGQAKGVITLTAIQNKIIPIEFTPLQVKQAVTGYGRADKQQVQKMIQIIFKLKEIPKPDDVADALGVAWCAGNSVK